MNEIETEKLTRLVDALRQRTDAGELVWKEESKDDVFSVRLTNSAVTVATRDADGQAPYVMTLLDANGVTTESYGTVDMTDGPLKTAINQLFRQVRRRTSTAGAAIDEVLRDLET